MSLPSTQNAVTYAGNNSAVVPYPVPFAFFLEEDLQVFATPLAGVKTQLTLGADYTVTGGDNATGSIVTTLPIISTTQVFIQRQTPITQQTTLTDLGKFPSGAVEDALDRGTMISQELGRRIGEIDAGNLTIDGGNAYGM